MRVTIVTIPHEKQRYDTVGDWDWLSDGEGGDSVALRISVSDLWNWRAEMLIAIHELVEAYLCRARGISQIAVDEWDMVHADAEEPGNLPGCPYRDEHRTAMAVEGLLEKELGMSLDALLEQREERRRRNEGSDR